MNVFTTPAPVTITCHKRLAPYLEREVRELGFKIEETFITGVRITATVNDCMILNLSLRCASQVLYSLKKFRAVNADHIYNELKNYPWEELIPDP
ncbi:MAG: THUMP domain-containing protein, partial [Flavitalea sp.]